MSASRSLENLSYLIKSPVPLDVEMTNEYALSEKIASLRGMEKAADVDFATMSTSDVVNLSPSLRSLWNEKVPPISKLYDELLALVLVEAANVESYRIAQVVADTPNFAVATSYSSMETTQRKWRRRVEISIVVKAWRCVALECPEFWSGTRLNLRCIGVLQMLPRWKGYPRAVTVDLIKGSVGRQLPRIHVREIISQLLAADALEDLEVWAPGVAEINTLWPLLPKDWRPILSRLKLDSGLADGVIPPQLGAKIFPDLRHLFLNGCSADWKSIELLQNSDDHSFRRLATLDLTFVYPSPSRRLLDLILSSSQRLQSLKILDCLPSYGHRYDPTFQWHHASLQYLYIHGLATDVAKVFARVLSMPLHVELRCQVLMNHYRARDPNADVAAEAESQVALLRTIFRRFSKFINRPEVHHDKMLRIVEETDYFAFGLAWRSDDEPTSIFSVRAEGDQFLTRIQCFYLPPFFDPLSFSVLNHLCIPAIRAMEVRITFRTIDNINPSPEKWRRLFETHPKLEVLTLAEMSLEELVVIIGVLTLPQVTGPALLPQLQQLRLQEFELAMEEIVQDLETMLVSRWRAKVPIAAVKFWNWSYGIIGLDSMRKLRQNLPDSVTKFSNAVSERNEAILNREAEERWEMNRIMGEDSSEGDTDPEYEEDDDVPDSVEFDDDVDEDYVEFDDCAEVDYPGEDYGEAAWESDDLPLEQNFDEEEY